MNKQATKGFIAIIMFITLIPMVIFAEDKPESDSINDISYYSTQDDLTYLYSLVDEGLMDSRDLYQLDKRIYDIVSNPKKLRHSDFDAIDFEIYTKSQERINKH